MVRPSLAFEPNVGQSASTANYVAHGRGFEIELRPNAATLEFNGRRATDKPESKPLSTPKNAQVGSQAKPWSVTMQLLGSASHPQLAASEKLPGTSSYFPKSDVRTWHANVPTYGRVNYGAVYPGIDLSFYGRDSRLEYDFTLAAGANTQAIRLRLSGMEGASIDSQGELLLRGKESDATFLKPVAYQLLADGKTRQMVDVQYGLDKTTAPGTADVTFTLGKYDPARPLVIDPVLTYAEYLPYAAEYNYWAAGVKVDSAGNTYELTSGNGGGGFAVIKVDPSGNVLSNISVGSSMQGEAFGLALDASNNIYVTGYASGNLPTTSGAYQPADNGASQDAFLSVLNANGSGLLYSSYLGGSSNDVGYAVAVDTSGNAYITGRTQSLDFPTSSGVYQPTDPKANPGYYTGWVAKFNPTATGAASLVYSTYLSSAIGGYDYLYAIAVDTSGDAFLTGNLVPSFPVTNGAYNYSATGGFPGNSMAYVVKLNPTATALLYSAQLGPGTGYGIAIDSSGASYVTGQSATDDYPTTSGAYQVQYPGPFATKLSADGTTLAYSTYLGGPSSANISNDPATSIALPPGCASNCAATIAGYTYTLDFPAINAIDSTPSSSGNANAFLVQLAANGASATLSTYFAAITGAVSQSGFYGTPAVTVDASGNILLAFSAVGTEDFPYTFPIGPDNPYDYLAKISPPTASFSLFTPATLYVGSDYVGQTGTSPSYVTTLRNLGSKAISSLALSINDPEFTETDNCGTSLAPSAQCTIHFSFTPDGTGTRTGTLTATSDAPNSPITVALSGNGYDSAYLQFSATQLSFGDQALNTTSATQNITVTNTGSEPATLNAPFYTNSSPANEFSVLSTCPGTLNPGASCTIGVTFTPIQAGLQTTTIYANYPSSSLTATGSGITSTGSGSLALPYDIVNFGTAVVGVTTGLPTTYIYAYNTGSVPVTVTSLTLAPSGSTDYTKDFILSGSNCVTFYSATNTTPNSVDGQGNCYIYVQFSPSTTNTETVLLNIANSTSTNPLTATLMGTGIAAVQTLEFSPSNLVFADQPLGFASGGETPVYVSNQGTATFTIDRIIASPPFSVTYQGCSTLQPVGVGANDCQFQVTFTPTATGVQTGTVTVYDTAGNAQVLSLAGTGITPTGSLSLENNSLTFAPQATGTTSSYQTITAVNTGNSPVTINTVTFTGDFTSLYANSCVGTVVQVGSSCGIYVQFTPTKASGSESGSVTFASTSGNLTASFTGTAEAATQAIGLTPTSISFGKILTGTSDGTVGYHPKVWVRNTGTEAVTFNAAPTVSANFTITGNGCGGQNSTLAPNASCEIDVEFTAPAATGAVNGTLTLTDTAGSGTQSIALSGTSVSAAPSVLIQPAELAFNQQALGSASGPSNQYVYLVNTTTTAINITSTTVTGDFYIQSGYNECASSGLGANSNCYSYVGFKPTATGYRTGTLTFTDSNNNSYVVPLAGYAPGEMNQAALSPDSLVFADQVAGVASSSITPDSVQAVYLYNYGNLPFTVGTLSGPASSDFTFSYNSCTNATVQPNGSYCQVNVTFTPSGTGHKTGTVTFPATFADNSTQTLTLALSGNGVAPTEHATLTPTKVTYLDQVAGTVYPASGTQSATRLTFTNDGNISLTVGQFSLSDTSDFSDTASYAYDQCSGVTLTAGRSCYIGILFTPSSTVGTKSGTGTLPFHYNDTTSTAGSIGITLSGNAVAANNSVYLTPTASQFLVEVINTEDQSAYTNFYVSNNGNSPVTLGQESLTANFTSLYDQCSGITLQPTQQCLERVTFTPTSTSSSYSTTQYTGTLSIPVHGGTTLTAALSGTGIPASQTLVLSQPAINFGNVNVGSTSAQLSAELVDQGPYNTSTGISSVKLGGTNASDFTFNNGCGGASLSGRQTCTLYATFSPAASSTGTRTATITVTYGTGQTLVLNLTGNGANPIPQATVYPTTLNFGSQGVGATSATQSFSVTNTGSANLVIGTLTFNNSTVFPVEYNNCSGATLTPQSSCQVGIAFDPSTGGSASGSASIPSNATTQSVSFTGTGSGGPVVSLTPGSLTFSSQAVSSTSTSQPIVIKNTGGSSLTSLSISIQGTNSGDFAQSSNCTATLAAGSSCTVNVTFDPTAVGTRTAELYLTDNASGSPQTAALTGTGTQESQTISFTAPTSTTYGASPFNLTASASSGLPVTFTITSGPATISGSTLTITGAGTIKVTASQAGNTNYAPATSVTQTFTVSPAPLTVTATSTSRAYGAANPAFTYTITGFQYSDTSSVVSGSATETTTATSTSSAGTYPITFATEALTATNYTFSYVSGTLTVTAGGAATPLITVGTGSYTATQSVTITDTTPNSTIYYTLNGTTPTTNSTPYTGPISVSTNETIEAVAIATGYTLSNTATATYTFIPATTNPTSLAYGSQANESTSSPKTVTVTNPGANSLSGFTPSFSGANASDFAIVSNGACGGTVAGGGNCVLSITFTPHDTGARTATLNISYSGMGSPLSIGLTGTGTALTPSLTLTPSSTSVTYGQSLSVTASLSGTPAPTGSVSYALDGGTTQTATLSGGSVNFSLGVLASGSHSLAATYNGDSVYGTTTQTLTFTVAKAVLTATAANLSRQYGAANPTLTYAVTGFVNGDPSSVVTGTATLSTTATSTSPVGTYPITFATESLTATNYTITYVAGTLTVSGGASQTITFGALSNQTYGASPTTLTATASSGLPVTYTVTGPATVSGSTLTITGAGSVTVTAAQAGNSSYAAAPSVSQSFTVAKAVLTATATNLSRQYGAANPTLTYAVTGFVNGDPSSVVTGTATLSTTATSTSPVGTYPITFATESLTATNYTITYVAGTLTVTAAGTVVAPNFNPPGGTYTTAQSVVLTAAAGATIYYTTDSSTPGMGSTMYTTPIQVAATETINAIAILNGVSSTVSTATYIINTGQCTMINYANGFTSTGLSLNGGASVKNNLLQLTDGYFNEARSAFYSTEVPTNGFTTDFTFQILLPLADGFTFVIQSNNPQEVGQAGGGLGYAGIPNSVAIKLDLFNNSGEGFDSVGAYVDGAFPSQPSINLSNTGIQLHSGHIFAVHIVFANAMTTATITDTQTNASYSMSAPGDLTEVVGNKAYIGFTGGTGALTAIQNILTWSYEGGAGCSSN